MARVTLSLFVLFGMCGCASLSPTTPGKSEPLPYGVELTFLHPVPPPATHITRMCAPVPASSRDHVYIYLVNGLDPLYVGNLKGLGNYCKASGFSHVACGEMADIGRFRRSIGKVHRDDPAARVVLVGYSSGANCVRALANDLKEDGIAVDLLVYIGGDTIRNVPASRPSNVRRVLNITGHGLIFLGYDLCFNGCDIDGAVNRRLDARHMLLPSRPQTAELLVEQLVAMCEAPAILPPQWGTK